MKTIINIFKNDIKKIFNHKIAIIMLIGILIIPGIYAWININSNWNPYENTSNLPIAIVNKDIGTSIFGRDVNMGNLMENSLKENNAMKWIFTDEENAKENVDKSIYYGVIIIPEDFSQKCVTIFDNSNLEKPNFDFYINQKKNPVAPIIVDKAVSTIQNTVNQNFVNTIIYNLVNTAEDIDIITKTSDSTNKLIDSLNNAKTDISNLSAIMSTINIASDSTGKSIHVIRDLFPTVQSITGSSRESISDMQKAISTFSKNYQNTSKNISSTFSSINDISQNINFYFESINFDNIKQSLITLDNTLNDFKNDLINIQNDLNNINNSRILEIVDLQKQINSTINDINNLQKIIYNINDSIKKIENLSEDITSLDTSKVQKNLNIISESLVNLENNLNNIKNNINTLNNNLNLPVLDNIENILDNMINKIDNLETITSNTNDTIKELDKINNSLSQINFDNTKENLNIISDKLDSMKNNLNIIQESLNNANNTANLSQIDKLNNRINTILKEISNLQTIINNGYDSIDNLEELQQKIIDLNDQISDIENTYDSSIKSELDSAYSNASKSMSGITNLASSLDSALGKTDSALLNLISALDNTKNLTDNINIVLLNIQTDIDRIINSLQDEMSKDIYNKIANILQNDANVIADYLTSLVETNEIDLYNINSYGSKMAPFYTVLACWVGCTLLVSLFKTDVKESNKNIKYKNYQTFFGRFMIFGIVAMLQGLIIGIGDIILQVQVINYPLFLLTVMLSSLVFMMIVYSLTISFGKVGQAISIVFMVLQVAGSGGTFPIELLPRGFQIFQPFMPFYPAMNALRETIGGFYQNDYIIFLLQLFCHIIIPLLLGLSFRKHIINLKNKVDEEIKDTDLIL